jgi:hypothetical protein
MRLEWTDRGYEFGIDQGVIYPPDMPGEAWNGLITVQESPGDSVDSIGYQDGIKYINRQHVVEFVGIIEAFTKPLTFPEAGFARQQPRPSFDMCYRVQTDKTYKLHILYNVQAAPSNREYRYKDPSAFSWDFTTLPIKMPGGLMGSHLVIDFDLAYSGAIEALERIIYGWEETPARLPDPEELYDIFEANSELRVDDLGNGIFRVTGPDSAIIMTDSSTFEITWPTAIYLDPVTYVISSS